MTSNKIVMNALFFGLLGASVSFLMDTIILTKETFK